MLQFRNIVEKVLKDRKEQLLQETRVIRLPKPWKEDEKFSILENPSIYEYESFLNNTKFHAIRGVSINGNIYIADADVGLHDNIIEALSNNNKVKIEKIDAAFEEDKDQGFSIRGNKTPKILELFGNKINSNKVNKNNLSYFDLEYLYNNICVFEDEDVINEYNKKFNYKIDFNNFRPMHKYECKTLKEFIQKLKILIKSLNLPIEINKD